MKLQLQADDAGIGKQATEMILDAWEQGMINGFGIISNENCGQIIKAALAKNKERHCVISAHLNLTDGLALARKVNSKMIASADGHLNTGFAKAFFYLMINNKRKELFLKDVYEEWDCQIRYIKQLAGDRGVTVINGHNHIHMLPSLFILVNQLAQKHNIPFVRVIKERMVVPGNMYLHKSFFWKNLCKLLALRICKVIIQKRKIKCQLFTEESFGVVNSGHLGEKHIQNAIKHAKKRGVGSLEIIVHPGQSLATEMEQWASFQSGKKFFTNSLRKREWDALKQLKESDAFTDIHY